MKTKKIKPINSLRGEMSVPGDKSISHRAIMIGSIAKGITEARGILDCDDCNYTIRAFQNMGVAIEKKGSLTIIEGKGLRGLTKPSSPINVGNSGTSMRLLAGILAGQNFKTILEGAASLANRPMKRIVEPLSLMGVDIKADLNGYPPITIRGGRVKPVSYKMPISSAQVKSAILLAGLYASGVTKVEESFKSRDHTERMLKYFGSELKIEGLKVSVKGGGGLKGRTLEIPGDISSASFFIVGATLLKGSKIKIVNVSLNPTRTGILEVLLKMGAKIKISNKKNTFEPFGDIEVVSSPTKGIVIEKGMIPGLIDELPIIFSLAALSKGKTVVKGARELRVKETDRISSMKENLERMGANFNVEGDSVVIECVKGLMAANLKSFGDHRTCMAIVMAALAAKGESEIDDVECVSKSFPGFFEILEKLC